MFRSADQAVRAPGRYLGQRMQWQQGRIAAMEARDVPMAQAPSSEIESAEAQAR